MAFEYAIVRAETPAVAGTVDYTDSAITDWKVALFYLSQNTTDATFQADAQMLLGACDHNGNEWCFSDRARSGQAFQSASNRIMTTASISMTALASTLFLEASHDTSLSNGVRMDYTTTSVAGGFFGLNLTVVLLGGDIDVEVGATSAPPTGNTVSLTDTGLTADLLIGAAGAGVFNPPFVNLSAPFSYGFCLNDLTQMSAGMYVRNGGNPSVADGVVRNASFLGFFDNAGNDYDITVTDISVGEFTVESSFVTPLVGYVAIEFTGADEDVALAMESVPATVGAVSYTGLGLKPVLCLAIGSQITTENTRISTGDAGSISLSVFTDAAEYMHGASHEVGVSPTVSVSYTDLAAFLIVDDDGTLHNVGTFSSFLGTGVELTMTGVGTGRMILLGISSALPPRSADVVATATATAEHLRTTHRAADVSATATAEAVSLAITASFPLTTDPHGNVSVAGVVRGNTSSAGTTEGNAAQGGTRRGNIARAKVGDGNVAG